MRIDFKKPQNTPKNTESLKESKNESKQNKSDSQTIYDKSGKPITNPELIAEVKRINALEKPTAKETRRKKAILKHGDNSYPSRTAQAIKNNNPQKIADVYKELDVENETKNQTPDNNPTPINKPQTVICLIEQGNDPIAACKLAGINYRKFLNELEKPDFKNEKLDFLRARTILADTYIYKLNILQQKLLEGIIDQGTYSAISRDLLYLAGKFAPATFGDKISIEKNEKIEVNHTVDQTKIANLNKLLALPSIAIDAEFEEV